MALRLTIYKNGYLDFSTCSNYTHRGRNRKKYTIDEIDFFGTYYNGKTYLIPISEAPDTFCRLRINKSKNNQSKNIRWAIEYELDNQIRNMENKRDI